MAEFITDATGARIMPRPSDEITEAGMGAMGHPIPLYRRHNAFVHCRDMGMTDNVKITACVGAMADKLERDMPYEAMAEGMRYVDLTGTYRLMAVLLTGEPPEDFIPTEEALATLDATQMLRREQELRAEMRKRRRESWQAQQRVAEIEVEMATLRSACQSEIARIRAETDTLRDTMLATFEQRVAAEVERRLYGTIPEVGETRKRPIVL